MKTKTLPDFQICISVPLMKHTEKPPGCSVKKDVLRNFAKFTGKHLRQRLISNKVARLELY